jgi:hypothetical protein
MFSEALCVSTHNPISTIGSSCRGVGVVMGVGYPLWTVTQPAAPRSL